MRSFQAAIEPEQFTIKRRRTIMSNLNPLQWKLIEYLKCNDYYIVIQADKNLGPCILDRIIYVHRGCSEHLGNERNYKILSKQQAMNLQLSLRYKLEGFLRKFNWIPEHYKETGQAPDDFDPDMIGISNAEADYLNRAMKKYPDKLARFRMTMKVHKHPWKMRPIVCCAGTFMNAWSKWLDYWLQKLKPFVPTYTRDSQQLLDELKALQLPPDAILFTADANSMYNNIDTEHAIEVVDAWLDELQAQGLLPPDFPLEAVKYAMRVIMRNNTFEYGALYFLQLLGTAMGTSAAVMWATIYYGYHESHCLIPKYGQHLFYFRRFIDDIFAIWIGDRTQAWSNFKNDVNDFGILTWDIDELSNSVNFLDLTLSINNGKIITTTYQKAMNLYLYLPPSSAHPRSCIKGTIFGPINHYYTQNTYRKDYIEFVVLLYQRILEQGWSR